jgi:hypothetical protein
MRVLRSPNTPDRVAEGGALSAMADTAYPPNIWGGRGGQEAGDGETSLARARNTIARRVMHQLA